MDISFIVPGDNRSGGVRVTVELANKLIEHKHEVRILVKARPVLLEIKTRLKKLFLDKRMRANFGWVSMFKGKAEIYHDINKIKYTSSEIVVGVGTLVLQDLYAINNALINRVRYNHGFPAFLDEDVRKSWSYQMPSIAVSRAIVPLLEELSPGSVIGVVPNGVDPYQYYDMSLERDGIMLFYSEHPSKAPDFMLSILNQLRRQFSSIKISIVSTYRCPRELSWTSYYRFPSIEQVRVIYNTSKVLIVPSDTEGFGLPIVEAMLCGTAVVSTATAGAQEIITHGENGFLTPKRDLEKMIDSVKLLLDNQDLSHSITNAGKERAKSFTWDKAVAKMEEVLSRLTSEA